MQEVVSEIPWLLALVSCMVAIYTTWMYKELRIRNQELINSHAELYCRHSNLTETNMKLIHVAMQLEIERNKYKACCDTAHYGMEAIDNEQNN